MRTPSGSRTACTATDAAKTRDANTVARST